MCYFSVGFLVSFRSAVSTVLFFLVGFAAFSFALAVFFLLLTSFIVCQAILDCLSSTESLILSIWFWMHSVCSFIYTPANWYCAVFSFKAFVFVGFFSIFGGCFSLVHVFSLTANVSQGTIFSFEFCWNVFRCCLEVCIDEIFIFVVWCTFFPSFLVVFRICFLILIRIYLLYLCCSIGPSHSVWWSLFVWRFFHRLNRIFAVTIRWSVDTPSKEEYASQFIALFFHFLFIRT